MSEVILFTDGACALDGKASGAGYLARSGDRMLLGCLSLSGQATTSNQAEASGLREGIARTLEAFPGTTRVVAVLDSESMVRALKGWSALRGRSELAVRMLRTELREAGATLDVRWTRGHADEGEVYGFANGIVDRLAKHALASGETGSAEARYDEGWATRAMSLHPCLRSQPRYVGHATAAAWLGVLPAEVPEMVRNGSLTPADRDLVTMNSVRRERRTAMVRGMMLPNVSRWTPGPLDVPERYVAPVVSVRLERDGGMYGLGSAVRFGRDLMLEALPFDARRGRLVAEIDALRYTIEGLEPRLVPVGEVRVQVQSDGLRSLLDRSAVPGDDETRFALWSLRDVERRARVRLAVEPPSPDAEVEALGDIARHLAWQSLEHGVGQEGNAVVDDDWHEIPAFWGSLGLDAPGIRAGAPPHGDPEFAPSP